VPKKNKGTKMNTDTFTDDQMLNLINNYINKNTKFEVSEFTGGYVSITINTNKKQDTCKVVLLFGYKNRNSQTAGFEIDENLIYIWIKAIKLKIQSLKLDNTGMDFNEINGLMNTSYDARTKTHCTLPLPNTNEPITKKEFQNFKSFLDLKFFLIENNKDDFGNQFVYEFEDMEISISDGGKAYDRSNIKDLDQATNDRFYKFLWKELKNAHRE
jgi:hypothetical protein